MTLSPLSRRAIGAAPIFLLTLALAAAADEPGSKTAKGADDQMIEGVVVRVEPRSGEGSGQGVRLTINSGVVWRDYVRDTATEKGASTDKAAEKGDESVATKGQPRSPDTMVVIDCPADKAASLRYRAAMDERSLGAASPEAARQLSQNDKERPADAKSARQLKPVEVKKGLWAHVTYHRDKDRNVVDKLIILEPVRDQSGK